MQTAWDYRALWGSVCLSASVLSSRQEISGAASLALRLTGDWQQSLTADGLLIKRQTKAKGAKPLPRRQRWHRVLSLLGYHIYIPLFLSLFSLDPEREESWNVLQFNRHDVWSVQMFITHPHSHHFTSSPQTFPLWPVWKNGRLSPWKDLDRIIVSGLPAAC